MPRILGSQITGWGWHAPARRVENAELEARFSLPQGWIAQRTGIQARTYVEAETSLVDLARPACLKALERARRQGVEPGLLVLATSTPDHLLPPSAPHLAHHLGLSCGAMDLAGACAGFLYAFICADNWVRTQGISVLVVAANILSRRVNPHDRASAVLFGDAAGAIILTPSYQMQTGVLGCDVTSNGASYDLLQIPNGERYMHMREGKKIFSLAVDMMAQSAKKVLAHTHLTPQDITRWIPHQANARILEAVRSQIGLLPERGENSLADYGNASAASMPFALARAIERTPLQRGERLLLTAAGAGFTGGALIYGV